MELILHTQKVSMISCNHEERNVIMTASIWVCLICQLNHWTLIWHLNSSSIKCLFIFNFLLASTAMTLAEAESQERSSDGDYEEGNFKEAYFKS